MDWKQILKFVLVALMVVVGMRFYDKYPIATSIVFAVAGLVVFGKTIAAKATKPVDFIGLAIVWVGAFYLCQIILGYTFDVPLEDLASKIDTGGPKAVLMDPPAMGKIFLKQALSLLLAGIVAWWFIHAKHRGWLLGIAASVCAGYLYYATYLAAQPWFQQWSRTKREQFIMVAQEDENATALDVQFRRAVSLGLPKMTIGEEGIPLWFNEKQPDPPLAITREGDVFVFNLSNMRDHPDPRLKQVKFVWAAKDTKGRYETAGFFRLDLVAKYVEPVIEREPLARLQPPVSRPVVAYLPAPTRQPTVQPVVVAPQPVPAVVQPPVPVTDQVLATVSPVPTKIIPQQHDRVILKAGGRYEDAVRLQVSWGGRVWDDVQPEFVEGQWGGILLFDHGKNPRNQPLLVRIKSGDPIPVSLVKNR